MGLYVCMYRFMYVCMKDDVDRVVETKKAYYELVYQLEEALVVIAGSGNGGTRVGAEAGIAKPGEKGGWSGSRSE